MGIDLDDENVGGGGDVTGPASSVDDNIVLFNGTDGKTIKDSGVSISDILGDISGFSRSASRDAGSADNIYLRQTDGVPTNVTPIRAPYDCTLIALTAQTNNAETWVAEVHIGLALVTGAFLAVTASDGNETESLNIDFDKGDKIQLYANGINLSEPSISVYFIRR